MPLLSWLPTHDVDDFGRDPHLVRALCPLASLRWDVSVGGTDRLPTRGGALLVCNSRRMSLTPLWAAWAIGQRTGRVVRFVGRPDTAPIGAALRRIGALLDDPTEVATALRHHELVLMSCASTTHARHAGTVDPELVGAAVVTGSAVFPVATTSSSVSRAARAEVGAHVRPRHHRRGPLAEVELAEQVQRHIQRMLDGLGGTQTGVAPIDWLADG